MKINIVQFEVNGEPDTDMSIIIPEDAIKYRDLKEENIIEMLSFGIEELTFYEKQRGGNNSKEFPALKLGNWYLLWVKEVSSWIVIYFLVEESNDGFTSSVEADYTIASGPYNIGLNGANIIKKFYNSNLPIKDIIYTSPEKLKKS